MFGIPFIEWVGYLASLLLLIAVMMPSIAKLRLINSIACIIFIIYGLGIQAYPVAISNLLILIVNIYNLYKLTKK